jgi:sulfur carrier protein
MNVTITVNGEVRLIEQGTSVDDLLNIMSIPRTALAVERNREIVSRDKFAITMLEEGDKLEIVSLVGGG